MPRTGHASDRHNAPFFREHLSAPLLTTRLPQVFCTAEKGMKTEAVGFASNLLDCRPVYFVKASSDKEAVSFETTDAFAFTASGIQMLES